ncbi:penicillin-binding transpeptidase domain-containing protein [Alkalicoccobacillus murimartini]|uniref:serine-type D-Ala-D-Ala carboxypeptidase n=1 Tax=Alkalicoccobacillus murimartini TaxID=171685 RepID=A0ABT9YMQ7_9BACI|nr:penicillin-binding transpeptidase domain-containing protein [Alkalicoccobacillus murimartini]MDQ0208482.1 penicillin-binding protein [Alkalicoccobacillus murimartini]
MHYAKTGIVITGLFSTLLLTGCFGDEPDPKETLDAFIEKWENNEFEDMYAMLTNDSKEAQSEGQFEERTGSLYDSMHSTELTIEAMYPDEDSEDSQQETEDSQYSVSLSITLSTEIGTIEFEEPITLALEESEEEESWAVTWDESLVYPAIEAEDTIEFQRSTPTRGQIFDRNGNGLAINGEVLDIGAVPGRIEDRDEFISEFSELTGVSEQTVESRLDQEWVTDESFVPIHTFPSSRLDWAEEDLRQIPGASYELNKGREYPYSETAAHLTGYIQDITAEQLGELKDEGYGTHDKLGQTGLERVFEDRLRGTSGGKISLKDNEGETKETILEEEPEHGEDITLTIDMDLQQEIFDEVGEDAGTASAIHPTTGEILALVNRPSYDPNQASFGFTSKQREEIDSDEDKPRLNRFAQIYSPGSTFKLLTAAIGLEEGTLDPNETLDVQGDSWQPEGSDWGGYEVTRVSDYGEPVDLRKALVYSDNIYFANQALNMGEDAFVNGAEAFGFGEDLPLPGLFNTSSLTGADGIRNDIQLADSGYGQGEIQMTPLHLGLTFTTIVNEGNMIQPILELDEEQGIWKESVMSAEHAELLQQDLVDVIEDSRGSGHAAAMDGARIAGKTGTAELKASQEEEGQEHGWFVAVDADEDPELLLVMMIDDVSDKGGSGYVVDKVATILDSNLR